MDVDVDPARRGIARFGAGLDRRRGQMSAAERRHGAAERVEDIGKDLWFDRTPVLIDRLYIEARVGGPPEHGIRRARLIVGAADELPVEVHRERRAIANHVERDAVAW